MLNRGKALVMADTVTVTFRGSKSDQFGEGCRRTLGKSGQSWCCPVRAAWYLVQHHISLGARKNTMLCRVDKNTELKVSDVVILLQVAAEHTGNDLKRYGSHSIRSGGATALSMQAWTVWRSSCLGAGALMR
jgi:hypothetical protein